MPTPFGHGLAALTLGALAGLDDGADLVAFVGGAMLPDADLVAGLLVKGDPMHLHRRYGTHSLLAPLASAALAASAGGGGRRRRAALAGAGALLHLAMDSMPWVFVKAESISRRGWFQFLRSVTVNSLLDVAAFGPMAYLAWRWRAYRGRGISLESGPGAA